jgi:hypothetical protein
MQPLEALAERVIGRLDRRGERDSARAVAAWVRVTGPEIGRHTHGSTLRDGVLIVYVDSSAWANELTMMSEELRGRVNEAVGKETVRSMRFIVSRRVRKESEAASHFEQEDAEAEGVRVKPVPLTEEEAAQVEFAARTIPSQGLRQAAIRAVKTDLEWKKALGSRKEP